MDEFGISLEYIINRINMLHIPSIGVSDFIEIVLLSVLLYNATNLLRGTRAWNVVKAVITLTVIYILSYFAEFNIIVMLFNKLFIVFGIAIVVIMQPELRRLVDNIGTKRIIVSISSLKNYLFNNKNKERINKRYSDRTIQEIVRSCSSMGKAKTGALIVIEGDILLSDCIESGICLNSDISSQLLLNIFEHNTPLHDGAIIIRENKIISATCYLPLTDNRDINKKLGTRHRAGIGVSEKSDCLVVVVSEETGSISCVINGNIDEHINIESLTDYLKNFQVIRHEILNDNNDGKIGSKVSNISRRLFKKGTVRIKIMSLLLTACLWGVSISILNPIETITINNIEVNVENEKMLNDNDKTYKILGEDKVNLTITDRKNVIDSINVADISVVADMSNLSITNAVEIKASIANNTTSELKLNNNTLRVELEDIITTELSVETLVVGEYNPKFYMSNISIKDTDIVISGAKSIINKIGKVIVEIDQSTLTKDTEISIEPKIIDKNGDELSKDKLSISCENIKVGIQMYNTKKIPISINAVIDNKILKELVQSINVDKDFIYVAGEDSELEKIDRLDITVPVNIKIGDISKSQFIKSINTQDFIDNKGLFVTQEYTKAQITINFKEFWTNKITIKEKDIKIEIPSGYSERNSKINIKIEIPDETFINLVSSKESIDNIKIEDIKPYIDFKDICWAGEYNVYLKFNSSQITIDKDAKLYDKVAVKVTVTDK